MKHVIIAALLAFGAVAQVLADSCRYCGRSYGSAAPGDEGRIASLRAAHEASCSRRPRSGSGGGYTSSTYVPSGPSPQELARQRAINSSTEANNTGVRYYKKGDYRSALEYFKKALSYNSGNATARGNLRNAEQAIANRSATDANKAGITFYEQENWSAAISKFEEALRHTPNNSVIQGNLRDAKWKLEYQQEQARREAALDAAGERIRGMLGSSFGDGSDDPLSALAEESSSSSGILDFDGTGRGTPLPNGNGLDFFGAVGSPTDGAPGRSEPLATQSGLTFRDYVDSSIVDARDLPGGAVDGLPGSTASAEPDGTTNVVQAGDLTGGGAPRPLAFTDKLAASPAGPAPGGGGFGMAGKLGAFMAALPPEIIEKWKLEEETQEVVARLKTLSTREEMEAYLRTVDPAIVRTISLKAEEEDLERKLAAAKTDAEKLAVLDTVSDELRQKQVLDLLTDEAAAKLGTLADEKERSAYLASLAPDVAGRLALEREEEDLEHRLAAAVDDDERFRILDTISGELRQKQVLDMLTEDTIGELNKLKTKEEMEAYLRTVDPKVAKRISLLGEEKDLERKLAAAKTDAEKIAVLDTISDELRQKQVLDLLTDEAAAKLGTLADENERTAYLATLSPDVARSYTLRLREAEARRKIDDIRAGAAASPPPAQKPTPEKKAELDAMARELEASHDRIRKKQLAEIIEGKREAKRARLEDLARMPSGRMTETERRKALGEIDRTHDAEVQRVLSDSESAAEDELRREFRRIFDAGR